MSRNQNEERAGLIALLDEAIEPQYPWDHNGDTADLILAAGYRQQRGLVAEIFDEFEKLLKRHCTCLSDWQLFYELKKKYLGGEQE